MGVICYFPAVIWGASLYNSPVSSPQEETGQV
ncbi:Uncharacterised protein [Aeromonas salmonicida]|nr:Uncharacterised protein [Aeromonas salmonicida]